MTYSYPYKRIPFQKNSWARKALQRYRTHGATKREVQEGIRLMHALDAKSALLDEAGQQVELIGGQEVKEPEIPPFKEKKSKWCPLKFLLSTWNICKP